MTLSHQATPRVLSGYAGSALIRVAAVVPGRGRGDSRSSSWAVERTHAQLFPVPRHPVLSFLAGLLSPGCRTSSPPVTRQNRPWSGPVVPNAVVFVVTGDRVHHCL